jgi:hypothetical protein
MKMKRWIEYMASIKENATTWGLKLKYLEAKIDGKPSSEERKTKTLEILKNMLKENDFWSYWSKERFMNKTMITAMNNLKI